MFRNYLLTAWKVYTRRGLFTAINLACITLTLGVPNPCTESCHAERGKKSSVEAARWAAGVIAGQFGPEAAIGGPIALLKDGDVIMLDAGEGVIEAKLSAEEFDSRRRNWKPRDNGFGSGYLWKYTQQVGPARDGAVTHPGGVAERQSYADI